MRVYLFETTDGYIVAEALAESLEAALRLIGLDWGDLASQRLKVTCKAA